MDLSSEYENGLLGSCQSQSESRVKCEVEECADLNYNPCGEMSSQHSVIYFCEPLAGENFATQRIKEDHLSEQNAISLDDSNSESSDSEEFADLLQQCFPKATNDVMIQSTDSDPETYRGDIKINAIPRIHECTVSLRRLDFTSMLDVIDLRRTRFTLASNSHKNNRCPTCKKSFRYIRSLKEHIQRVHMSYGQHCCADCKKLFRLKMSYIQHMKRTHGDKKYDCDRCDFSTKYSHVLKIHISAVHLEEKPHKCLQCDYCCSRKGDLKQHIKAVHNHEKPYECSLCDKLFSTQQHLNAHWRSFHCGEKPFSCDKCDYKCSGRYNLTRHQNIVHDGIKPFGCDQCEYKSSTKSLLKHHIISAHAQFKPFSCFECGKAFNQSGTLRAHIDAIHRRLKPYSCVECNKNFSCKAHLQSHNKYIHNKEKSVQ